jgi:hypothetical protein
MISLETAGAREPLFDRPAATSHEFCSQFAEAKLFGCGESLFELVIRPNGPHTQLPCRHTIYAR